MLSDIGGIIERIAHLQQRAATDPPCSCREALEQARLRASRDAELRDLLAELGAALVDALFAGQGEELVAALAAAIETNAPAPTEPPAPTDDGASDEVPAPGDPDVATADDGEADPLVERPEPVAITPELLRLLQQRLHQNGLQQDARRSAIQKDRRRQQLEKVGSFLEAFGPTPSSLPDVASVQVETDRLEQLIPEPPDHWAEVGKEANHALTSWAAARARAAQEAGQQLDLSGEVHRLDRLFPRLSRHSKISRPGIVHGLARAHQPFGAGWLDDASSYEQRLRGLLVDEGVASDGAGLAAPNHDDALRRLREDLRTGLDADGFCQRVRGLLAAGMPPMETRLVRLARPFLGDLVGRDLAPLRRAVERELDAEAGVVVGDAQLPPDWPWLAFTQGKRCALVGGEPRPERREKLQEVFGFASLDWLPNPIRGVRRAHALTQQMRSGSLDLVIVLRAFISHKVSGRIFAVESPGCRTILAENYGVTQVRLGIERFLVGEVVEPEIRPPSGLEHPGL